MSCLIKLNRLIRTGHIEDGQKDILEKCDSRFMCVQED